MITKEKLLHNVRCWLTDNIHEGSDVEVTLFTKNKHKSRHYFSHHIVRGER